MGPAFGTDGVRAQAFDVLDEVVAHAIGRAANTALFAGRHPARWVVGRDTRASGFVLERALIAGLRATGAEVTSLGIVPTPVVAFAAQHFGAAGAMVSASHNPWRDNGVKLFAGGGAKLSDEQQRSVARCFDGLGLTHGDRPAAADVTRRAHRGATRDNVLVDAASTSTRTRVEDAYAASLRDAIGGRTLAGVHVVVDGANGAWASLAPAILRRLGARVTAKFCEPDGRNINDGCGSVSPGAAQAAVLEAGADLGLAFDGDGDRLIAVDSDGQLIDGDRQMALFAADLAARGLLAGSTLVVTVMSNLGLRRAMTEAGIAVVEAAVGDRAVLEALDAGHYCLGGEQSGHIVFRHEATTGDGLRSAVHLADLVARRSTGDAPQTSAELASGAMQSAPQVLRSVPAAPTSLDDAARQAIEDIAARAGAGQAGAGQAGSGARVLVRASGTEPVIRVMVEAPTEREAHALADRLVAVVAGDQAAARRVPV
ncbi:phosphoglucosamine mutase [Candidatus Poriferisodalis sp.]|uniref:phosphoglucosamine mutase n=1 Tax=Candidatus Poriferisodalis sp. TaxID=3101277 RepID=UPI003B021BCC